jgi:hypothetical protein
MMRLSTGRARWDITKIELSYDDGHQAPARHHRGEISQPMP